MEQRSTLPLEITLDLPANLPKERVVALFEKLATAASELHQAHGGKGLTVGGVETHEPALVPAGGPQ